MSVRALHFEDAGFDLDVVKNSTRWTMTVSVAIHVIVLLMLMLIRPLHHESPTITEITMIDPSELEPASSAGGASSAPIVATPVSGVRYNSDRDTHFKRDEMASVAPDPQTEAASDRLNARLAAMQQTTVTPISGSGSSPTPSALWSTPAGSPTGLGASGQSVDLHRGGAGTGPPIALSRGGSGTGSASALAVVETPKPSSQADAPAKGGDNAARRSLAGAMLAGPIADRAILQSVTPVYPEWAKKDGVEGAVTIYFVVRADGSVKENVMVQKTAGFSDFDDNARAAILAWRFEPLHGGRTGEQWGTITFAYRLRGTS